MFRDSVQKKNPLIHHRTTTTATTIPANLNTATRFPAAAMRVSRDALLDRLEPSDVKCSVCGQPKRQHELASFDSTSGARGVRTHVAVDQVVVARVVVDVDGDVAQLRDLAAQGVQ
jgi:hypothetical protein